jgi:hypothetical protein
MLQAFLSAAALLRISDPNDELCCVLVRSALRIRYGVRTIDNVPISIWHAWPDGQTPGGAASGVVLAGVGALLDGPPRVGRWHVVQTWHGAPLASAGHTWFWFQGADGTGIRLDSAARRGPDGGIVDTIEDGPAATITTFEALTRGQTVFCAVLQ